MFRCNLRGVAPLLALSAAVATGSQYLAASEPEREQAASEYDRGLEIARKHKQRNGGWQDSQSDIVMIIRSANGKERQRRISVKSLEVIGDGDKSLMVFNEPGDVAGTAFLSYSHVDQPDDQWIYLPALKRVKRIASKNKSGAFMGSEFSYEDMNSFEVEKYDFRYLGDDTVNGRATFRLEMVPTDKYSGYSKTEAWLDQDTLRFEKIAFYDRKGSLLKELTLGGYTLYEDTYWRPTQSVMQNRQTGKVTEMLTDNIRLRSGLSEDDFSQNSLKRAR